MKNIIITTFFLLLFSISVFSQKQIDEFGRISCGSFNARMDSYATILRDNPNSKLYIVHYDIKNRRLRRGLYLAKGIPFYLQSIHKIPAENIVLINGGFKKTISIETWLVGKNEKPPKTPILTDEETLTASEKRAYPAIDCAYLHGDGYDRQRIDTFNTPNCENNRARLDFLIQRLRKAPESKGAILIYEGDLKRRVKKGDKEETEFTPSEKGLAKDTIEYYKTYFRFRGFPLKRITFIEAGFREDFTIELWFVPKKVRMPEPRPTLKKIKQLKRTKKEFVFCGGIG